MFREMCYLSAFLCGNSRKCLFRAESITFQAFEEFENQLKKQKIIKKMKKNIILNWIFLRSSAILMSTCAGFVPMHVLSGEDLRAENKRLKAENQRLAAELAFRANENDALRKELIETLDKYSTQAGRMRRMEASSAGTIETLEPVYTGAREMEVSADLLICISSMKKVLILPSPH